MNIRNSSEDDDDDDDKRTGDCTYDVRRLFRSVSAPTETDFGYTTYRSRSISALLREYIRHLKTIKRRFHSND